MAQWNGSRIQTKGWKGGTRCLKKTIFNKLCRYTSFSRTAGLCIGTGDPELRHCWTAGTFCRELLGEIQVWRLQPASKINSQHSWPKNIWLYPLISARAVSSQGREGGTPFSGSAGRCPCLPTPDFLITKKRVQTRYLLRNSGAALWGSSLLSVVTDTFVHSQDGTEQQRDPAGKRHSTKAAREQLARVIQVLAPAMTGESAGSFL